MNKNKIIPLHVHTCGGSLGDSILKIDDYIEKAKNLGLKSLAITNHGSMADVYEFSMKCFENNIKPIIGCEVYVKNEEKKTEKDEKYHHLVLIAKNKNGFRNLLNIHNYGQLVGFYYKPIVTKKFIKENAKDLICLSACVGGEIPKKILKAESNEDIDALIETIKFYKETFKDDFYLEIQPGNFKEQVVVNKIIEKIYKNLGTKIIVTNDVHYLNKEDYIIHNIHVCAGRKNNDFDKLIYPDKCYYFSKDNEIIDSLKLSLNDETISDAINSIEDVDKKCENYKITSSSIFMPKFDIPKDFDNEYEYIYFLCFKRLKKIENKIKDVNEYSSRIEYEMETIRDLGFGGYFLVVRDYIEFCNKNNIKVGPGRGSCCGSLILYLLEITKVDPIKYNLMFERFLSKHRKGMPDIDVDIDAKKRYLVFEYIVNKYGKDKCALVSTFIERKSKAAIRDTARVYNIDSEIVDIACSLIPEVYYTENENGEEKEKHTDVSIEDALELEPKLKEYANKYEDWFNAAIKLTDVARNSSIHAAGTLISPVKLADYIPLIRSKDENLLATQLMLKSAEDAGFIKYDLLALNMLSTIRETEEMIGKSVLKDIDDEYSDEKVWNNISSKNTIGLFQISSNLYKQRMRRLNPRRIEDLAICLALVRGPSIASGDDMKYINILEGKNEIEKIHPLYDIVTERTNGILVYQEQLMEICFNIGFTLDEGYAIMKASSKKKIKLLKEYGDKFYKLCKEKNIDEKTAKKIFKMIVDTGLYSFNESHAVAYAIACYMTAYLKTYYPAEYMASVLTGAYENKKNVEETIEECYRLGLEFLPVDVNKSEWNCIVENKKIRLGYCAIKGFGTNAANHIMEVRPFNSLEDFYSKIKISICKKNNTSVLILSGGFDEIEGSDRYNTFSKFYQIHCPKEEIPDRYINKTSKIDIDLYGQNSDFEKLLIGYDIISSPINSFEKIDLNNIKNNVLTSIQGEINRVKKLKDKNKNNMAFIDVRTPNGILNFVVFASNYEKVKKNLKKNNFYTFNFKKNKDSYIIQDII